jgi:hypothetical protein
VYTNGLRRLIELKLEVLHDGPDKSEDLVASRSWGQLDEYLAGDAYSNLRRVNVPFELRVKYEEDGGQKDSLINIWLLCVPRMHSREVLSFECPSSNPPPYVAAP